MCVAGDRGQFGNGGWKKGDDGRQGGGAMAMGGDGARGRSAKSARSAASTEETSNFDIRRGWLDLRGVGQGRRERRRSAA